jgi:cobalt-zinc-cadmium efflux system protein
MSHASQHTGDSDGRANRRLLTALVITLVFMLVEAAAGFLGGSLVLLSDAGHMLTDAGALALALYAQKLAVRTRSGRRTFGYRRAEILAALVNGAILGVTAFFIIFEALRRFRDPPEVPGRLMLLVAAAGLVANVGSALVLSRGLGPSSNVRAALVHVLADAAGSVAAMIAGALVMAFGWVLADPTASIAVSALVLVGAFRLLRDAVNVLMEGAPAGLDAQAIEGVIRATPGVGGAHDLHVWSVSDGFPVVTVHVVLQPGFHGTDVAHAVATRIEAQFGIEHITVQPEVPEAGLVPRSALARPGG